MKSFSDDDNFKVKKILHEHFIKIIRRSQGENTKFKGTDYKSPYSEMAVLSGSLSALSCRRLPIIPGAKLMQLYINIYTVNYGLRISF